MIARRHVVTGTEQAAAIARGKIGLRDWVQLLEVGTDEQIAAEVCWRGAMITADILVFRALREARGWKEEAA